MMTMMKRIVILLMKTTMRARPVDEPSSLRQVYDSAALESLTSLLRLPCVDYQLLSLLLLLLPGVNHQLLLLLLLLLPCIDY